MISTVTISTVTTVTAVGLGASLAVFGTILLVGFLTGKALLGASGGERQTYLARAASVGIIPLVMAFLVVVSLKIIEVLS